MAHAKARGQDRAPRVGGSARRPAWRGRGSEEEGGRGGLAVQGRAKLGKEFRFYSVVLSKTTGGFK